MNFHRPRRPQDQENSMIPLINVVFLLLAFFMILGRIESPDAVRVEPPHSLSREVQGEYSAILLVTANQSLHLNNRPLKVGQLAGQIRRLLEQAADPQSVRVLVKADGSLPAADLRQVLARLRAGGLLRVSLATKATIGPPNA
ncbi:MAG: biopolymer transporter ExbD [Gammaproteobacteria bacterium]|nr:biopolymer transporter ExbD [Gammaproteobacteria bacterium]MCY4255400.1 biopolymer transporter ExbD [Gammaproteobacteria bacterium]